MASLVGATSSNTAEQIQSLKAQADTAFEQQKAAEKAVASFTDHMKNNQTPENVKKLQELHRAAQKSIGHATELRRNVNDAELAHYNPRNNLCLAREGSSASLARKQVAELNLEAPPGYFPD
jgi:hypothetical protein